MKRELVSDIDRLRLAIDNWGLALVNEMQLLREAIVAINIDRKTEPQIIRCPKCGRTDYIRDMEKDMGVKGSCFKYKCINCNTYIKTEPQTELVNDSPILVKDLVDDEFNPYDEECMRCKHLKLKCEFVPSYCKYEPKDEPQTERSE